MILRDLSKLFDARLKACTLSDRVGLPACCETVRKVFYFNFVFLGSVEEDNMCTVTIGRRSKKHGA